MDSDSSTWLANKRRLALLVLLHRRPYEYDELIAALDRDDLFSYDQASEAAVIARKQRYQFRNDLRALRKLSCDIRCDRRTHLYIWHNSPFGLSLNQAQLTTFALLLNTFNETMMIHADEIKALLTFFIEQMSQEQRKQLQRQRFPFSIDLHETTDYHNADAHNIRHIEMAIERSQQLKFTYRSLKEGKEHTHVIEAQPLVFERGHVYLNGWSPEFGKALRFRLDYILPGSAEMLPTRIAKNRPSPVSYVLRYQLSPVIARNGVSQHFADQQVAMHPDGSATVTARITDLFDARRTLLSYGENCTVLEPPALVEQMRKVAVEFSKKYLTPEE
jgi:proteasome accessory factor C